MGATAKFDLSDSSPQLGFDWLLSMFKEIRLNDLPYVFEACIYLETHVKIFMDECIADRRPSDDAHVAVPLEPLDEWLPHLDVIRECVHDYIQTPVALTSGHRGLAHKAAARAFGWTFLAKSRGEKDMKDHAKRYPRLTWELKRECRCSMC